MIGLLNRRFRLDNKQALEQLIRVQRDCRRKVATAHNEEMLFRDVIGVLMNHWHSLVFIRRCLLQTRDISRATLKNR